MELKNIKLEIENSIAIIKINRPEVLNALNKQTLKELYYLFEDKLNNEKSIKVVLITGEGKAFVAGADIKEMANMSSEEARQFSILGQTVFNLIENYKHPVIAVINGFALGGGCELAMACDIRIASKKAKLGQPEVSLGVTPGFGGTQRLTRLVGIAKAKELLFTGDIITSEEAMRIGLVNYVYEPDELIIKAKELASKIAEKSPIAVTYCKQSINMGLEVDLNKAMLIESNIFGLSFATHDQKEGMKAFIEKRKPNFKGE